MVCNNCGLVINDTFIDEGPEWRAFDSAERNSKARTGPPIDYRAADRDLSTTIIGNRDSYGNVIPARTRQQVYRLKKWHQRLGNTSPWQRKLQSAMNSLDHLATGLNLPRNVRDTSILIYKQAIKKDFIKGRKIDAVAAASAYAACRQCGVPRTLEDVAGVATVDRKEIGRTYRYLTRELSLQLMPNAPQDYVDYFCNQLNLSQQAKTKALDILRQADEHGMTSGRGPTSVAAAAVYIAAILCDEHRTQQAVAEVAGVTEVTIRNRYKELPESKEAEALMQMQ
jgi:transcription initiation factor TFIIB